MVRGRGGKRNPVKAQIQSSRAAEFSSKAGNRWTGTAAEGAAASPEKQPRRVLRAGASAPAAVLHGAAARCQWVEGLRGRAAHGAAVSERSLPAVPPSSRGCTLASSQDLLAVAAEEKDIKDSLCS